MYEVFYRDSYQGLIKEWRFKKVHDARAFYSDVVRSLKDTNTIFRLAGDGSTFFIKGKPLPSGRGYNSSARFMFRREGKVVQLGWEDPDRKDVWIVKKYVSFETIFKKSTDEIKKTLAFHFDIFA